MSNLPVAISNASGPRCAIRTRLDERQASAKEHHDARGVTDLPVLSRGQIVRTRHPDTHRWEPARIVNACQQPRSSDVESTSGRILRRNRRDIRETTEQHLLLHADDDDDPRREENPKRSDKSASDSSVDERDPQRQTTVRYVEPTGTRSGRIIRAPPRLDL